MRSRWIIKCGLFLLFLNNLVFAYGQQGLCPPNLDFENGDFTNWLCRTGMVANVNNQNVITWSGTGQTVNRHAIINSTTAGVDVYGGFSESYPNGSGYSVKLGNSQGGFGAESISYTYDIPANVTLFSILYQYAVVLQNPSHTSQAQPRFRANVTNLTDNVLLSCVAFDFTASSSLPGFKVSTYDTSVLFKDWTPVTLNLSGLAGKKIQVEFITSDCTEGGHFGYAYVDVNSSCNSAITGASICEGDKTVTLNAPYGFQSYKWFSNNSFSQVLSTTQQLPLNPLPPVGSVFPVIVNPFPGFGCLDTLYATIAIEPKPIANAGLDISICKFNTTQIGAAPVSGNSYAWVPANKVSNPNIANPFTFNNTVLPSELIVKATNILSGCFSYDTIVVFTKKVDTSIQLIGKDSYCIGDPATAVLSLSNTVNSIQWYRNNFPVAGATSNSFLPSEAGKYWASVNQNGCTDSTDKININIYSACNYLPSAFTPNGDGLNDIVKPFLAGLRSLKGFSIYNRWGSIVFFTKQSGEGWDGTYKGKKLDSGTYVWLLEFANTDGKVIIEKGLITLIR